MPWSFNPPEISPLLPFVTFSLAIGCYLVFAGQFSTTEIVAAISASGLTAAFAAVRQREQNRPMRLRAPWLRLLKSALVALVVDTSRVGWQFLRLAVAPRTQLRGSIDRQPFRPGGPDRADAGRRALATLATSFAPNGFVMDVAPSALFADEPALLMHALVPKPPNPDVEWPV